MCALFSPETLQAGALKELKLVSEKHLARLLELKTFFFYNKRTKNTTKRWRAFLEKGVWGRQSWNKCVSFYIITCACLAPKCPADHYRFLRCGVPVWPGDVSGHFAAHCTTLCFPFVRASVFFGFLFLFFVVERVPKLACV